MYIFIPILALVLVISFVLGKKSRDKIVSDRSPFSFADDMLVINTGTRFAVQFSQIDYIELQYNPKSLQNRFYDMKIKIVKTDGSSKNIKYKGSGCGSKPADMAASLKAHNINCSYNG